MKFASLPAGSESATADLLRRTVQSVDPALPILEFRTFAKHMDSNPQLWIVRAGAALFSVFGGLALGLAVVGVYGVKAYSVARRTREIGIRMALGAEGKTVQWMILREGLAMVAAGLALGLLLAFGTGKIVSSILFQVSPTDPFAFTLAPVVAGDGRSARHMDSSPARHENQSDGRAPHRMKTRSLINFRHIGLLRFSAKGAGSFQPGATPKKSPALKARFIVMGPQCEIRRTSDALNRAFSARSTTRSRTWGDAPGWSEPAPLALNWHRVVMKRYLC